MAPGAGERQDIFGDDGFRAARRHEHFDCHSAAMLRTACFCRPIIRRDTSPLRTLHRAFRLGQGRHCAALLPMHFSFGGGEQADDGRYLASLYTPRLYRRRAA